MKIIKKIILFIKNMFGNSGFMMDGLGPGSGVSITGKWINKSNGHTINVRDNVITDEGMNIICSDGRIIPMEEFSKFYVQASDEIYDNNGNVIGKETVKTEEIVEANNRPPMFSESKVNKIELENNNENVIQNNTSVNVKTETPKDNDNVLITKLFNKLDSKPTIKVNIEWADIPKKEISTLVNFLDVPMDEISNYIYNNFANKEEISKQISKFISNNIVN